MALQIVRALIQGRPIERAWCHWQRAVLITRAVVVFKLWAATARQQRLLEEAQRSVCARKNKVLMACVLGRWRRRTGASTLARLLHAWAVIGPARKVLGTMRILVVEARVAEEARRRLLRCVLTSARRSLAFLEPYSWRYIDPHHQKSLSDIGIGCADSPQEFET